MHFIRIEESQLQSREQLTLLWNEDIGFSLKRRKLFSYGAAASGNNCSFLQFQRCYVRLFAAGYIIIFFDIDQNRKP